MKVGLYFGSFNPIHTGHLIIASHVLNTTGLEKIWMIVSPRNPFKNSNTLLNEYDRMQLVQLAIGEDLRMRASDIEFSLPKPSYTSITLAHLSEKYPEHQFTIIMGGDSFQNLHKWKNAESIIRNYPIYVYPRPGFDVKVPEGADITLIDAPLLELSATQVRELVHQGKSIRYMVPDAVMLEIEKNGYYK
ncbi:MAG: nicotinate-nucleotide adenylyltransferase [Chitinophagaceae bacterium]|nr:MAG: nicotinate-nucleotide adenylyltransferase [Chitinophagaceae bacterium]